MQSKGLSRVFSNTTVLDEAQAGIKIARRNINNLRYADDTLMAESEELVKAMVFPVVMCGSESWTIKKAEHQRIDLNCGAREDS